MKELEYVVPREMVEAKIRRILGLEAFMTEGKESS